MVEKLFNKIIKEIRVELTEEFDRNFERKAFFDQTWSTDRGVNKKGSQMNRTGFLRKSYQSKAGQNFVKWSSSAAYANIQNEGGTITVTDKMKRFFWARYYEISGAITVSSRTGKVANTQRNQRLSREAQAWKNMALMKTGSKITIPSRRVIGDHPQVQKSINKIAFDNLNNIIPDYLKKKP